MTLKYRSVWISDVHLGTRGCKAEYLLDFLRHVDCDFLYLVGDIIDFWKMKSGWYWPTLHNDIVRHILERARRGTRVIFVPGNHDEVLRGYADIYFCGVEIRLDAVHTTADGRKMLIVHGDEFDGVVCTSKWLAMVGSEAYDLLLILNRWFNFFRRRFGFPYWSLSAYLKYKVKETVNFICNFETALARAAQTRGADGVICGHVHHAAVYTTDNGMTYANCGDWVEGCTALAEDWKGRISLIRWVEDSMYLLQEEKSEVGSHHGRLAPAD